MDLLRTEVMEEILLASSDSEDVYVELASEARFLDLQVDYGRRRHDQNLCDSDIVEVKRCI